jgi:ADP-ribosyl-[dinitrogen reductase] hydrolase
MVGGGGFNWAPGEFTDDTQMAMALAESLCVVDGVFHPETTWNHFKAWAESATDIGNTTISALSRPNFETAAKEAHDYLGKSGSNGSVMRIAPVGIAGVRFGRDWTIETARVQSRLTHYDLVAGWSAAIAAELIRRLIVSGNLSESLLGLADIVDDEHRLTFEEALAADWTEEIFGAPSNGSAVICLSQAIWAVRSTSSYEQAVVAAINLGDVADTVGAVTGAIAGALYGIAQIPSRWATYVHGHVQQPDGNIKTYRQLDLQTIAHELVGRPGRGITPPETAIAPRKLHELGVYAANISGAEMTTPEMTVVSLCRAEDRFIDYPHRREIYLIDTARKNPNLGAAVEDAVSAMEAFLADGKEVLVHCHGGRSRTGLILKAWYMRRFGVSHQEAEDWVVSVWEHYESWTRDFAEFLETSWK